MRLFKFTCLLVVICCCAGFRLSAGNVDHALPLEGQSRPNNNNSKKLSKDSLDKKKLARIIVAESTLYVGGISYLSFVWYKDRQRVPFHLFDDRKGYLQIDKMGHAWGAYLESKTSYNWLRSAGVSKNKALIYGGTLGIILQAPIEVFDGIYPGWGFSWSDIAANTAGSALLIGQEILFDEQILDYKFSFNRSKYADHSNGMLGDNYVESLFLDYNGHSYWLSINMNRLSSKSIFPDWLNLAVGYGANGMYGEFENRKYWNGKPLPETERYRQYFISLDIDWTEIETDRYLLQQLFQAMNYIKLPAPALEYNGLEGFKFHALYF